ncbi:phage terminase large subunit family protein [Erysipelotrichia bacterium]
MQSTNSQTLADTWQKGWSIKPKLNPWRWAEENLEFSTRVSSFPGRYSTAATPYVREPLEKSADRKVRRITLEWSAQSAKTTTGLIVLYYRIPNDPGNALIVRPSLTTAKSLSENRAMITIDENPVLAKTKTNDKDDFQKTMYKLRHMVVFWRGANPNQLAAESIKFLFLDETEKYPVYKEEKAEADLISLAIERTKSYINHLIIDTSTPSIPSGPINQAFLEGTQKLYFVPCPHCGCEFTLKMEYFKFDKNNPRETAYFECPHCKGKVEEKHKPAMMAAGRWIAQNLDADGEHESYRLPEFYSAITRWGDLARKFVKAVKRKKLGDLGPLHNFINSSLAEPWDPKELSSRKAEDLLKMRDNRKQGEVPDDCLALLGLVDTQDVYFWVQVIAFGPYLSCWEVFSGPVADWADIDRIMFDTVYKTQAGKEFKVVAGGIDSGGHRTAEVYEWCRLHPNFKPIKGVQQMGRTWDLTKLDKFPDGRIIPMGLTLLKVNTTYYKNFASGKLAMEPHSPGAYSITSEHQKESDLINHLTAEYRDEHGNWVQRSGKRNDLWDTFVYGLCLADMMRIHHWQKPDTGINDHVIEQRPRKRNDDDGYDFINGR